MTQRAETRKTDRAAVAASLPPRRGFASHGAGRREGAPRSVSAADFSFSNLAPPAVAPAAGAVVQRSPADFVGLAQGLKNQGLSAGGLGGLTLSGWTPWSSILGNLDEYAALDVDKYSDRKAKLTELNENIMTWKLAYIERRKNQKTKNKDGEKDTALDDLLRQTIPPEAREVALALGGGLNAGVDPQLSPEPVLTSKAKNGVLKANTTLYLEKGLETQQGANQLQTPCVVMHETKEAYQVQMPDPVQFQLNNLVWLVRWVRKADVTNVGGDRVSEPRTDVRWVDEPRVRPLFPHKPNKNDVQQGGLGDCYLLAALLSIVDTNPGTIEGMMSDRGDAVTVRLYDVDTNHQPTQYQARNIKVKKSVAKHVGNDAEEYARESLWVQMLEKAYTLAGYVGAQPGTLPNPSIGKIASGHSNIAWQHLLGRGASMTDIDRQPDAPVPAISSPWGDTEKRGYRQMQESIRLGAKAEQVYPALSSWAILGNDAGKVDTWMQFIANRDVEAGVRAIAQKGKNVNEYRAVVRLEDFAAYFKANRLDDAVARLVVGWLEQHKYYPGKRGTGKYTAADLTVFQQIRTALNAGRYAAVGTEEEIAREAVDVGHSAGEPTAKGLAGNHAYAVLGVRPNKANHQLQPNEVLEVLARNPWGVYGRTYKNTRGKKKAQTSKETPEFWLDLSDLTKRFNQVYTTD